MRAASKDTDPAPTMTCSALTENRVARCSRRVSAVASGYRLSWAALSATACSTDGRGGGGGWGGVGGVVWGYGLSWAALSATACSTDGSGGKGFSLLESLNPSVGARRPCR